MGQNIGDIVESSLVENLNPSTDFSDMDWIKPGVAAFPLVGELFGKQLYRYSKNVC